MNKALLNVAIKMRAQKHRSRSLGGSGEGDQSRPTKSRYCSGTSIFIVAVKLVNETASHGHHVTSANPSPQYSLRLKLLSLRDEALDSRGGEVCGRLEISGYVVDDGHGII